jgi:hypothetical protein
VVGGEAMKPLWFFWSLEKMPYLRYATLETACRIHDDVRLVIRKEPGPVKPDWWPGIDNEEKCGFMGVDWMPAVALLPIRVYDINDFAPEIADMRAPGLHTGDMLKWWTLAHHGGHVADMDIAFIRPLPEIEADVEAVVWPLSYGIGATPMGLLQGRPCDWWQKAYERAVANCKPTSYFSTGPTEIGFALPEDGRVLDRYLITPWAGDVPWIEWQALFFKAATWPEIPESCVALHWHGGVNYDLVKSINGPNDLTRGAVAWAITGWQG